MVKNTSITLNIKIVAVNDISQCYKSQKTNCFRRHLNLFITLEKQKSGLWLL